MTDRPEAHFVRLCVREPRDPCALEAAARAVQDWSYVVELATRHRVAAYVLQSDAPPPSDIAGELRMAVLGARAVAMLLDSELARLGTALHAANVPVIVLKGPALARELYADPSLRPFADLDLTVREPDQDIAVNVLERAGYRELEYESETRRREHLGHVHESGGFHRMFGGVNDRVLVELHLDPLQLGVRATCEAERWARATPIAGLQGVLMLGLEDQVVQLAVHAHKHGFNRLIWLKDLDLLLRAHAHDLRWDLIASVAQREGVSASVWYALELTRRMLGTPLSSQVRRLRPALAVRLLYAAIWQPTRIANLEGFMRLRGVQFQADSWRGMLPNLVLMGRRSARARLLVHAAMRGTHIGSLTH